MKEIIEKFIASGENELDLEFQPLNNIASVLENLGFQNYNSDTNGWDVDFWYYRHPELGDYVMAGSLFYGSMALLKNSF